MQKRIAFQKNCIAVLLAVMLMICAFADGNDTAACMPELTDMMTGSITLQHPGAGEFFAGSLPQTEPQSVWEASAHWQELLGARGLGPRIQLCTVFETAVLHQMAERREQSDFNRKKPVHHSDEIIVCYIHNKDGQKG